ncbi:facilitated trehalose transporter Tret1-2 homolog [Agrilus planipennis]|uniref:Facilitated trehalose transporter Tret1-2 homolog n=1 Tax=Agrilus planipennis TaxID=224129 RepID=A0A1W4X0W5_AGRPL|nr:facilitated trehalose transporter Tret1-2 homolog [Agrilus planipennis]
MQKLPLKRKIKQFVATVCIGGISLGISLAWTSPVLPQLEQPNSSPIKITIEESSWIGATLAFGALVTAIPAGYLADCFGRKTCVLLLVIPVIIFTILVTLATNVYYIYVARIFSGMATGGVSVVAPMYIGEISDIQLRGVLGTFFEMLIYVGILITAVLGAYIPYKSLTISLGCISLALGVGFLFFPESPTYLLLKKNRGKAEKSLKFYRGNDADVSRELDSIQEEIEQMQAKEKTKLCDVITSKSSLRALIACVGLTVFQQLCAVDALTFYCVAVFQATAVSLDAYTCAIIVTVTQSFSSLFVVFVIEKLNRKTFLYISAGGTGVTLAAMGLYFNLKDFGYVLNWLPLGSMILFYVFFALGMGPIPWLVNSELFSSEIKGVANGITIASNWLMLFVVTKLFPLLMEFNPFCTFYVFAIFMILCLVFIKFCVPETKGKSLQQIQEELRTES